MVNPEIEKQQVGADQKQEKRGRRAGNIPIFPRTTLKKALEAAKAIEKDNAGDPFDPILPQNR